MSAEQWVLVLLGIFGGSGGLWKLLDWIKARREGNAQTTIQQADQKAKELKDAIGGFERLNEKIAEDAKGERKRLLEEMDRRLDEAKQECANDIEELKLHHDREMSETNRTVNNLRGRVVDLEKLAIRLGGDPNDV